MSNHLGDFEMQLTMFTDYALRSLIFLAKRPKELASVKEIAAYYGISRNHLVKVIHRMVTLGLIASSKGRGGGVKLIGKPEDMRLGDIVQKIENMEMVECFNKDTNTCRISDVCQLKHFLFEATQNFIQTLNEYTLADAAKDVPMLVKHL